VRDRAAYRRKLAYPILTLVVAGIVYFSSRGMIGTAPPPKPADYETAAREVMAAVRAGVEAVVILDGRRPHAMLVELFTEYGAGTLVKA
jgi:hypothetical protein